MLFRSMVPSIVDKKGATAPEVIRGEIEYDDVHFAYKEDGPEILQGVSFHVEPGETYALVGSSGAGKSTMISLVPRLYDVLGGAIRIDGKDVRDWPLQELRSHIGFVTQDTFCSTTPSGRTCSTRNRKPPMRSSWMPAAERASPTSSKS